MRIVINCLSATGSLTGIGHYTQELSHHLKSSAAGHSVNAFPNALLWPGVRTGRAALPLLKNLHSRTRNSIGSGPLRPLVQAAKGVTKGVSRLARAEARRYIRATLSPKNYDLYHEPNFIPLSCDLPTAITVHDLSVLLFPQWHPPARVAGYQKAFRAGLARSEFVFTSSQYVRFQVVQLLNLPSDRVRCLYPGPRDAFRRMSDHEIRAGLSRLQMQRDYFLYVGTIEPRKNLLMLLQVYCSLPSSVRERHPLVLAGPWGWRTRSVANYYEETARHMGVRHLGYVPEKALPLLYNGARCLVYPSHYEGFGLPPVEMLACGGAVLASSIATLVETVGNRAVLISPVDADGWREALLRAATDDDWIRTLQSGAIQGASAYSWDKTAQQAWDAYSQILDPTLKSAESTGPIAVQDSDLRRAA